MSLFDLFLLSVALGIDCLIVSFSQGLIFTNNRVKNAIALAVTMGLFQGLMPVIGFTGADYIYEFAAPFSKWIAFAIFFVLGLKFILEAFQPDEKEVCCICLRCLISLGIATSIDSLVAGISLNFSGANLVSACIIIGVISFLMSLCGFGIGNFGKRFPSKSMEITGGVILIFLSLRTLF